MKTHRHTALKLSRRFLQNIFEKNYQNSKSCSIESGVEKLSVKQDPFQNSFNGLFIKYLAHRGEGDGYESA